MLVGGRSGIGKTNLALWLAYSIATGTSWCGLTVERNKVLFLALEGPDENIADRTEKVESHFPATEDYLRCESIERASPEVMFGKAFDFIGDENVVIVDGGRLIMEGDYCKAKEVERHVTRIMGALKDNGVVGITTLQVKKPPEHRADLDDMYSIKGATEFVDSATAVVVMERQKRRQVIEMVMAKQRIAAKDCYESLACIWSKQEGKFVWGFKNREGATAITWLRPDNDQVSYSEEGE
jgi:hypothetical protein